MDSKEILTIDQEIEIRGKDFIGICEGCCQPIWDAQNLVRYEEGIVSHKGGSCGPPNIEINQVWLGYEIQKEVSLLALHDGLSNKRLNILLAQLRIYCVDDGAQHWVWAWNEEKAIKVVEENIGETMEGMGVEVENIVVTRLKSEDIEGFNFHIDDERSSIVIPILQSRSFVCTYIACSEY